MLLLTYPDFVLKNSGIEHKDLKKIKKEKKRIEILEKIKNYTESCNDNIRKLAEKCKITLENRSDLYCKNTTVLIDLNDERWYKKLCDKIGTSSITDCFGRTIEKMSRKDIANEKIFYLQDLNLDHTEDIVDLHYDNHVKVVSLFKTMIEECISLLKKNMQSIKTNLHMRYFSEHTYMHTIKNIIEHVWNEMEKEEPNQAKIFYMNSYESTPKIEKNAKFTLLEYLCKNFAETMNDFSVNHNEYCDDYNHITQQSFIFIIFELFKSHLYKNINYDSILEIFKLSHKYDIDKTYEKIEAENKKFINKTEAVMKTESNKVFSSKSILENVHFENVSDFFVSLKEKNTNKKTIINLSKKNENDIQKYHSLGVFYNSSKKEQNEIISKFFTFIQDNSNSFDEKKKYILFVDEDENTLINFKKRCFVFKDDSLKKLKNKIKEEKKFVTLNQEKDICIFCNYAHKYYINNDEILFKIYFKYLNHTVVMTKKSKMNFQITDEKKGEDILTDKIESFVKENTKENIDLSQDMYSCFKIIKVLPEKKWKILVIPNKVFLLNSEIKYKNQMEDYNQNCFEVKLDKETNEITEIIYEECVFSLKNKKFIKGTEVSVYYINHDQLCKVINTSKSNEQSYLKERKISKYNRVNKIIKDEIKNNKKSTLFILNDESIENITNEKNNIDIEKIFYRFNQKMEPHHILDMGKNKKALKSNNGPSFFYTNNKNKMFLNGHLIHPDKLFENGNTVVYYLNCSKKNHFDFWGVKENIIIGVSKNENLIWYLDRESQMERFENFKKLYFNPNENELKIIFQ